MVNGIANDCKPQNPRLFDELFDAINFQLIDLRDNDFDLLLAVWTNHNLLRAAGVDTSRQWLNQIFRLDSLPTLFDQISQLFGIQLVNQDRTATEVNPKARTLIGKHHRTRSNRKQYPTESGSVVRHLQGFGEHIADHERQDEYRRNDRQRSPLAPGNTKQTRRRVSLGECQSVEGDMGQERAVHRCFLNRGFVIVWFGIRDQIASEKAA